MRLKLAKLQKSNAEASKIRAEELKEDLDKYVNVNRVLHHQGLPFIPEIIWTKLINWKYYWPSLKKDVEAYVKGCDVYLSSKAVKHKPYSNLQTLPVLNYQWKDPLIDVVTKLPISTNWKGKSYNSILVNINRLTKMVHYELLKVNINASELAKVILNMVVWHYDLPNLIVSDRGFLFICKSWSSLCCFLGRTGLWRPTFGLLLISSRIIGPVSYWWLSLHITMPKMQALAIRF